ncbi:MAG: tetratricopeptide repeat protein [Bacteroidia bacterium]
MLCGPASAQDRFLDSVQKGFSGIPADTARVLGLLKQCKTFFNASDYRNTLLYSQTAEKLSDSLHYKSGSSNACNLIGNMYSNQGDFPKALKYYLKSLRLKETMHNKKGVGIVLNNIGNMYQRMGDFKTALEYLDKSISVKKELGDEEGLAYTYNNAGISYEKRGDTQKAMDCYRLSMAYWEKVGDDSKVSDGIDNIGNIYAARKQYDSSVAFHLKAIAIRERGGDTMGLASSYINIGCVYDMQGKSKLAADYLERALVIAKNMQSMDHLVDAEESLSEAYTHLGEWDKALLHYKAYVACRDSMHNEEATRRLVQTEMNYEFEKKEAASKLEQEKKEAVTAAESKKQKIIIYSICGILALVLAFAVFAYRSYMAKQKANVEITRQKEIIEEKQKEILDSIHYAKRIQTALMPREKYIERILTITKGVAP